MIESPLPLTSGSSQNVDYMSRLTQAASEDEMIALTAAWILDEFDCYYSESRRIPLLAKHAFENRDPATSLALSKRRLSRYSQDINEFGPKLKDTFPHLAEDEHLWDSVEKHYLPLIKGRYEADLAFAFLHSVRRKIYQGEWKPVEYAFAESIENKAVTSPEVCRTFPGGPQVSPETIVDILKIPAFSAPYRNIDEDAALVAERANKVLGLNGDDPDYVQTIVMVDAGFYRNRGAYLVGRFVLERGGIVPLIIALLNGEAGIYVDAVLISEADTHNLFSSTLANFHVTTEYYHQLSAFLHSIMPRRPIGLHYSTVGYNHVGKVAVMNELKHELHVSKEVLDTAVGFKGTVTIGFSTRSSSYNLKVIRDKPTAQYKWGKYEGFDAVLRKYKRVHEINRTGSMLDNLIYFNLRLEKDLFEASLLDELRKEANQSVSLEGNYVIFKTLIVQRKVIPLPVFFETASDDDAKKVIVNLGNSIKNNMAANIFNKDLDARNYGVTRFLKVYLFDYDALEPLTEVKIRTNQDRIDGEEDIPDWYFEDGVVFLPEEIESGLRIPNRMLGRLFREVHGDLLTTEYWKRIQDDLKAGKVPRLHVYPEDRKLDRNTGVSS
jgi:isocitrate dehydrogenase kinase/phosphatase